MSGININPMPTTNAANTFGVDWDGGFQGVAHPDPAARYALRNGVLAAAETLPMWGGVAINELIPGLSGGAVPQMGSLIQSATSAGSNVTGFATFNQAYGGIATPQSPVPLFYGAGTVAFFRLNSGARLWLPCSANIGLTGGVSAFKSQVSWDAINRQIVPYTAAFIAMATATTAATYNGTTGVFVLTGASVPSQIGVGSWVGVAGFAGTAAVLNGSWQVSAVTTTTISFLGPTGQTIVSGDLAVAAGQTTLAGGGAVGIQGVDAVSLGKSMSVSYAASTGFATWNRSGNCLLALL